MASSDLDIAQLVAAGALDDAATLLLRTRGPEIAGYLRGVLRDDDAAGDAFSAFCERAWRGLAGFRGDASLRSWCYRIAWNVVLTMKEGERRRRADRLRTSMASRMAGTVFATTVRRRERRHDGLARLRERLDREDQTLLSLRLDRELGWKEIAEVFAREDGARPSEAALRKRFERLKQRLAEAARDEGLLE